MRSAAERHWLRIPSGPGRAPAIPAGYCQVEYGGGRVDVFLPLIPFYEKARNRRRTVEFGDQSVLVWDAETRRGRVQFGGHGVLIFCVAWHPNGRRIASAGTADGQFTVKVWDATTGAEVFTLKAPSRPEFFAAAFSPDGRHLVTGSGNGAVQVWDASDGREVGTVAEVLHSGAQDLLVVARQGREDAMVPFVSALVPEVDLAAGRLVVADRPGLLEPLDEE